MKIKRNNATGGYFVSSMYLETLDLQERKSISFHFFVTVCRLHSKSLSQVSNFLIGHHEMISSVIWENYCHWDYLKKKNNLSESPSRKQFWCYWMKSFTISLICRVCFLGASPIPLLDGSCIGSREKLPQFLHPTKIRKRILVGCRKGL